MKQMLIDACSNIMMFDGKKLEALGKALLLRELIKNKLYAFGNDLYLKSDDSYKLLAENAEVFRLEGAIWNAEQQFTRLSFDEQRDIFVYINQQDHQTKLCPSEYIHIFYPNASAHPNMVIIQKGKNEHLMCVNTEKDFYILDTKAIGNEKNFFWHGGIYTFLNNAFVRVPIIIEHLNDIFMIIRDDAKTKSTFVVEADGNISYLGIFNQIHITNVSTILSTQRENIETCWHIGKDFIRQIVVSIADKDTIEILPDGYIVHHYKTDVGYDNGGIVDETRVYHLNENGCYVCN